LTAPNFRPDESFIAQSSQKQAWKRCEPIRVAVTLLEQARRDSSAILKNFRTVSRNSREVPAPN
jgi:hypothetical protein